MESFANTAEDKLIDGLSFKLQPGASYITDRRSVTFHPQGSNIYKTGTGTKLIKILLTGDSWLDPSTFRVMFDLENLDTDANKKLRTLSGPWSFFRRMRVVVGGQVVEDIDYYNRVHEMMSMLQAKDSRINESVEGFGQLFDHHRVYIETEYQGIPGNAKQTVMFKPLSGLFNQNKYLPIRYTPISLELELVDNVLDPILGVGTGTYANTFTSSKTSTNWQISNVQAKCDLCTLDNALDNSYTEMLLSGKSFPISYNTFVSQIQTITNQSAPYINVSRALTRLKSVFVSLEKNYSYVQADNTLTNRDIDGTKKHWSDFYSPASENNKVGLLVINPNDEFEFQLQVGSKLFPEYPIRSHAEAYYQLRKTLGLQSSSVHSFDISPVEYRDNKFVIGIDCEKVLEAGWTGLNTRAGDLMTVKMKYMDSDVDRLADRMHIILHSDQIMEISDGGVRIYD
jgi:hypothetical protein